MPGTSTGEDLYKVFTESFNQAGLDMINVISVITDGATANFGCKKALIQ